MSTVELIYATLANQDCILVEIKDGDTINDVINTSGILQKYSAIDLAINKVGIYNQIKKLDDIIKENDRIEIYRQLIANPKEVRRKRAVKQRQDGIVK